MSDSEEFDKITNAYRAAMELWKLASQQIYSRFAAMLTGNSIIVAAIGIILTGGDSPPICLIMGLIISGLVLSVAWILYMTAGWCVEKQLILNVMLPGRRLRYGSKIGAVGSSRSLLD